MKTKLINISVELTQLQIEYLRNIEILPESILFGIFEFNDLTNGNHIDDLINKGIIIEHTPLTMEYPIRRFLSDIGYKIKLIIDNNYY